MIPFTHGLFTGQIDDESVVLMTSLSYLPEVAQ